MRPIPDRAELLELMQALLANAGNLLDDASLLLKNERFPRAYALAALSGEELGKVYLCLDALLPNGALEASQFWWGWRNHGDKLGSLQAYSAAFVDDLESIDLDQLGPDARQMGARKMAAIYVDFDGHRVLSPTDITRPDATEMLSRVQRAVDHARNQLTLVDGAVIEAIDLLGPKLTELFDRMSDSEEPKEVLATLRKLITESPEASTRALAALIAASDPVTPMESS